MSDVLARICADKRAHIAARKQAIPAADIRAHAENAPAPRGFAAALSAKVAAGDCALIAEIKKASPSKGLIRPNFAPVALARACRKGGAACLSVLTDGPYFQGRDQHLTAARTAVDLPVLRKDFILDPYQVFEARALGADCILLIMAALQDSVAKELETLAMKLGMDVLIEVHDNDELDRALDMTSPLLGINNRNLRTLGVDIKTMEELSARAPKDRVLVAESGLYGPGDLTRMEKAGAMCFLVGEALMRQDDVEAATRALLTRTEAA